MAASSKTYVPLFSVSAKCTRGTVTPYKLSVAIFIQEYCLLKAKENSVSLGGEGYSSPPAVMSSRHRRDFCMLALKLIQSPDMEMSELHREVTGGRYGVSLRTVRNFKDRMARLFDEGISSLLDVSQSLRTLMSEPSQINPTVHRSSIIGIYLRRIVVYFDKLNFSQLVSLFTSFKSYYLQAKLDDVPETCAMGDTAVTLEESNMIKSHMETPASSMPAGRNRDGPAKRKKDSSERVYWSKRQADLFISQQAALIQNNEPAALPPRELQKKIHSLQRDNPDYPGVHFLRFLNCVRTREFCGAVDSLHHCWDRNSFPPEAKGASPDEKVRGLRYAALNMAMLHTLFGHSKEAIQALKEAIMTSHEGNDNLCLQHALAWLYKLSNEDNKVILMERSITKSTELNLSYLTSLGILALNQLEAADKGIPALIFDLSFTSDSLNCQHSMMDLAVTSHAQRAALWCLYGKMQMCSLFSQLVLHLGSFGGRGPAAHNGEGCCLAACNVANILTEQGEYQLAALVLRHAKGQYPSDPLAVSWKLSEQLLHFTRALRHGRWLDAGQAVAHLANVSEWESRLRKVELLMEKGDLAGAASAVSAVLDRCRGMGQPDCAAVDANARALVLLGEVRSRGGSPGAAVSALCRALTAARAGHQSYHAALAGLLLAHTQLQMGLPSHALRLADRFLPAVLSHGALHDAARGLLLLAKCRVAAASDLAPGARAAALAGAVAVLDRARAGFLKVEAHSRAKDVLYLQALLCNEVGDHSERNKYAAEFRQLDEQYPTKMPATLLTQM
ncbi:anaphase-promoting complex subunit 5 [Bacillus rossius redtenbacheri]|uniref:anaphase-promoting complex subunit 5 n=1 Tax=Bacillus rossius redtenbacheri TaxID=93214 RepID=UPI002FDD1BCF